MNSSSFYIYNASAGSGKTYSLVKAYLKLLIQSQKADFFKHILAITFTNKAVAEMKVRIIETLKEFSKDSNPLTQINDSSQFLDKAQVLSKNLEQKTTVR